MFIKFLYKYILTMVVYAFSFLLAFTYLIYLFHDYAFHHQTLEEYDYIIVGAGSAGSVVAARLAEIKTDNILVLEAGSDGPFFLDIPAISPLLQQTVYDWQYETEPQNNACLGLKNKKSHWPMGKIVGGTGRLNNMIYLKGVKEDYDQWYNNDCNYNYENDVFWYFKKAEHNTVKFFSPENHQGKNGPLHVTDVPFTTSFSNAMLQASNELGYSIRNLNGENSFGFMPSQVNMKNGQRWSTGHHLRDILKAHDNIQLIRNAFVTKIFFYQNHEANAIQYSYFNKIVNVKAKKGIVLSAGAVGTPKILMLSGIGHTKHLIEKNIKPINDLPVGDNLIDHITTGLDLIELNETLSVSLDTLFSPLSAWEYLFNGNGPWTSPACESVAVFRTGLVQNSTLPDLQFMIMNAGLSSDEGRKFRHLIGVNDVIWEKYFTSLIEKQTVSVLPILLHPQSVGNIRLRDDNPYSPPIINPNYLTSQLDVDILVYGIKLIQKLLNTKTMKSYGAKLVNQSFPGCETLNLFSNEYWECYIRHLTLTSFHPGGTCKLGARNDPASVVGYDFRVHNSNKLFIVDASVMPSLPSGNINAAIVMLAEKAADEIKRIDHYLNGKSLKKDILTNLYDSSRCL